MDIERLYLLIGETLDYCQRIEHDVKLIYAGMRKGTMEENMEILKKWTLGETIMELEKLDNCDNNPYLKLRDYEILRNITKERNFICHKCFNTYNYEGNYQWQENKFNKTFNRIKEFHDTLEDLWESIERVRLDVLKRYGRI